MAAPTPAEFKAMFPEFTGAADPTVQIHLNAAADMCDETVYGAQHYLGVAYRCADAMAQLPAGRKMQLVMKDGRTVYRERMDELVRVSAIGIRVL